MWYLMRMQRWIMHIDMDAFYASVEQLDDPSLKGKPVIVGGALRGVVSAASYEARKFGVHSAMPMFKAKRLCPHGVYVRGRMERYAEVSREIMAILANFSPVLEKASVDEAYIDATGLERLFGPVEDMARALKTAVRDGTGLTCSVGIAPVKFLAKIASDLDKPDGLSILRYEDVPGFLKTLPVGKIPGVGGKTLDQLSALGIRMAGDMARYPKDFWLRRFGKTGGILYERGQGIDPRPVEPFLEPKSESAENTFPEDTRDREELKSWLLRQSERVGSSLRKQKLSGRTITLKVKYADFTGVTRARTLDEPTNVTRVIYEQAVSLLEELNPTEKLRLIGVGVSHFREKDAGPRVKQLSFLDAGLDTGTSLREDEGPKLDREKEAALDAALDALRDKFGKDAVTRGRLFDFDPWGKHEE